MLDPVRELRLMLLDQHRRTGELLKRAQSHSPTTYQATIERHCISPTDGAMSMELHGDWDWFMRLERFHHRREGTTPASLGEAVGMLRRRYPEENA